VLIHITRYKLLGTSSSGPTVQASVLIPKVGHPIHHPLIVYFHGGFLIGGSRLYGTFFPPWVLAYAVEHNAIVVSADYRLLPTPNGAADINEDVEDLWQWTKRDLPGIVQSQKPGHGIDDDQVLVWGPSAGGYCAVQLALSHPKEINAVAAIYPMVDLGSDFWKNGYSKSGDKTISNLPPSFFMSREDTIVKIEEFRAQGAVTNEVGARRPAMLSIVNHGLWYELFDPAGEAKPEWFPVQRLSNGKGLVNRSEDGEDLPLRMWIMHGSGDTAVPIDGSYRFVETAKYARGLNVKFDVVDGQEHAFDGKTPGWDVDHPTIKAGLEYLTEAWLR